MRAEYVSSPAAAQQGFLLIEALVAILIFSLGVLGLVALGGRAVAAQSDAQYRTEASSLAEAVAAEIAVSVDRTAQGANIATSLAAFNHRPGADGCASTGADTTNARVLALLNWAANTTGVPGLPGAGVSQQQIVVQNAVGSFNRVQITLCWRTANDEGVWRRHTYVTYVNGGIN